MALSSSSFFVIVSLERNNRRLANGYIRDCTSWELSYELEYRNHLPRPFGSWIATHRRTCHFCIETQRNKTKQCKNGPWILLGWARKWPTLFRKCLLNFLLDFTWKAWPPMNSNWLDGSATSIDSFQLSEMMTTYSTGFSAHISDVNSQNRDCTRARAPIYFPRFTVHGVPVCGKWRNQKQKQTMKRNENGKLVAILLKLKRLAVFLCLCICMRW